MKKYQDVNISSISKNKQQPELWLLLDYMFSLRHNESKNDIESFKLLILNVISVTNEYLPLYAQLLQFCFFIMRFFFKIEIHRHMNYWLYWHSLFFCDEAWMGFGLHFCCHIYTTCMWGVGHHYAQDQMVWNILELLTLVFYMFLTKIRKVATLSFTWVLHFDTLFSARKPKF